MIYRPIKEGATVYSGYAFKRTDLNSNGDIPIIKIGNLVGNIVDYSKTDFISSDLVKDKYSKYFLADKDVLIAMTGQGSVGRVAQLRKKETDTLLLNQRVGKFVCNSILDNDYLFYVLSSKYYQEILFNLGYGSGQPNLNPETILNVSIPFPDIKTQKRISILLAALDDKIALNTAINENLEKQAKAIFKSWFVDFEPFGGVMPDAWRMGTASEIIELHDFKRVPLSGAERNKMEKIYPYYGATSRMDYVDNYLFDGIYLLLGEDGTVINGDGFPILQYVYGKFWVNNHAHIITGKLGYNVESLYLLFSLTNIKHIVTGAVQQKVSQANLKKVPVIIPDNKALKKVDSIIQPIFAVIRNNRDEIERLSVLRDTLLPKLMNGEIDASEIKI